MSKKSSGFFIILGLAIGLLALWITFSNLNGTPVILKTPEGAADCVTTLMNALCGGDYETAERMLYGSPKLGMDRQPESMAGELIYPLYRKSLSYEICGEPQVTDSGISLRLAVTALDTAGLAEMLVTKVMALPPEEAEQPESWTGALAEIPENEYPQMTQTITLNLVNAQNQWQIHPDEPLLKVISGTME